MTYHEQQKSKLEKHGPGEAHTKAHDRLVKILMACGFEVFPNAGLLVKSEFMSETKFYLNEEKMYYHEYDVYCRKEHDFKLKTEKIFEIDGSSHEKKKQQNRDHTAEEYAEFFLPDCPVYRVPISELIGNHKLTDAELWILYKLR